MVVWIFSSVVAWDADKVAIASAGVACNAVETGCVRAENGARAWKALAIGTKSANLAIFIMIDVGVLLQMIVNSQSNGNLSSKLCCGCAHDARMLLLLFLLHVVKLFLPTSEKRFCEHVCTTGTYCHRDTREWLRKSFPKGTDLGFKALNPILVE